MKRLIVILTILKSLIYSQPYDTLSYGLDTWGGGFVADTGDVLMTVYQLPYNATIKKVGIYVGSWGCANDEITVSIHSVTYPYDSNGTMYDESYLNLWLAGYDDDGDGLMELEGNTWNNSNGVCGNNTMVPYSHDPLGTTAAATGPPNTPLMGLLWPDSITASLNPNDNPDYVMNWIDIDEFGTEPELSAYDWVGIAVRNTSPECAVQFPLDYALYPWPSVKFYNASCSGTSGESGWHIRQWIWGFQLIIEYESFTSNQIIINEIMQNPSAVSDSDGGWFEFYNNNSSYSADLSNWIIEDLGGDSMIIPENTPTVMPNGYFVLGVNGDTTTNGGIHIDLVYDRDDFNLGNSDDEIILYNPGGYEIDRVEYDNGQSFPDPNGKSMELNYYGNDNNNGSNWSESTHLLPSGDYATPGATNSMLYPALYIELIEGFFLGTHPVTDTVYSYQLEVQNNGTVDLLLSSIETQLTGQENPDSYIYTEYDQDSIIVISPFQQGYIEIYFYTPYSSIFHDTLMFTTNDSNYSYVEIPIEAWVTAEEHEIHIEPSLNELIFDTIGVGQSQEKVLQIYNLGYTTLEIDEISTTPPFSVDQVDGSIDALSLMYVVVSFSPDSVGNYTGQLVIESNDSDEGTLVLTLVGYSYVLEVDDESNQLPFSYALHQNYPNPFNPVTTLRYDLPENSYVNVTVYDMLGREVKTLVNTTQNAGFKSIIWDATNDYGKPVSAGVYLYQIHAGEFVQTKKMVLLK